MKKRRKVEKKEFNVLEYLAKKGVGPETYGIDFTVKRKTEIKDK